MIMNPEQVKELVEKYHRLLDENSRLQAALQHEQNNVEAEMTIRHAAEAALAQAQQEIHAGICEQCGQNSDPIYRICEGCRAEWVVLRAEHETLKARHLDRNPTNQTKDSE